METDLHEENSRLIGEELMPNNLEKPSVSPGGLITVAFLKAQLDSGDDHIGIFLPLVLDSARSYHHDAFVKQELQERLAERHGVAMPQHVIGTLLDRATKKGFVVRDIGRFRTTDAIETIPSLQDSTKDITVSQTRLGESLVEHAAKRKVSIPSAEAALEMLLRFLDAEQVSILLGNVTGEASSASPVQKERLLVAEFIYDVVRNDPAYSGALERMLEGLVLYHAAFLPDISAAARKFKNLRVAFDGSLVRQALGLEGEAAQILMTETLSLLKAAGVQCLVFEKTVQEIRRVLAVYETRLATTAGQKSLWYVPMTRYLLSHRFTPGDVRQISALLEMNIQRAGFTIAPLPPHQKAFTAGEKKLADRLASPDAKREEIEERVAHDVDCIAGVLTIRAGHESSTLEDAGFVFAADQPRVIRNVCLWWREDEGQAGIEPIVHIRALANLAWLKKPAFSIDFKMRELVALCAATLRPSSSTWRHFLKHLEKLNTQQSLSDDEVVAIIVSATSDRLLREAEGVDGEDLDATTLDDIVERVKLDYSTRSEAELAAIKAEHDRQILALTSEKEQTSADAEAGVRRRDSSIKARKDLAVQRSRTCARFLRHSLQWISNIVLAIAVFAILKGHSRGENFGDATTWLSVGAIGIFYLLEATILRGEIKHRLDRLEESLFSLLLARIDPESKYDDLL